MWGVGAFTEHGVVLMCTVCNTAIDHPVCDTCVKRMRNRLSELPELYALAAAEYWPAGRSDGGSGPERTIGLRVAALDARSASEATAVLEEWERDWRDLLGLVGERGPLVAQRARKAQDWNTSASRDLRGVTLVGVTKFLLAHLDQAVVKHPAIDEFARELGVLHKAARRAARDEVEPVTVVKCPADRPDGSTCRAELRLVGDEVTCERCGSDWTRARLLLVAQSAAVDVWASADQVSLYLNVPAPTLRRWARQGRVRRRSGSYLWSSVVAAKAARGSAAV